ncbi:uncharacterized protein LOC126824187 [Patella vulgata]|uniref:uncharacterized protein LOC126824187 n=1 Tax=Patella vulgata TaxID=6465 RepID=UPI00218004E1|nr:uncharacterized protein LOC126824187 [Patella vulgata]
MTTNTQYHVTEYKRKDYGPIKEYKLKNKPKYHEYKSYHEYGKIREYNKIRNHELREYKAIKPGYSGYRPEKRPPKPENERLLPKRERQYNRMRWFRQLKHCYKLPMGPEYPVKTYKTREYKRKKQQLDYHEYKGYKSFKGYPEYNGSVHYPLTALNYYGFRRGKRVYRPITPATVKPKPVWYPLAPVPEPEFPQQTLTKPTVIEPPQPQMTVNKPLSPASEIVYPQQVLIRPATVKPVLPIVKEKEVYQPIIRENNGFYRLKHPVTYHEYKSYHGYNTRFRPYQYKEYNQYRDYDHLYIYTAKDMPDRKPHIFRQEKDIRHISYPEEPVKAEPVSKAPVEQPQKQPQKWKKIFAKEEKLKQQILIMPTTKPEKVKPRKKLPNQNEPVYPSQMLIMPTLVVQETVQETVVKEEQTRVQRAPRPRYIPIKREYVEESQVLILPVANKKPHYVPTTKQYVEESITVIAPKKKPPPIKPVEITEEVSEVVKPTVAPIVATAAAAPPPKAPVQQKYVPTYSTYVDQSVIVTMPKKFRKEEVKVEKPIPVPPPVLKVDKEIQTKPMTPIAQPKPFIQEQTTHRTPDPIVVPLVAAASKSNRVKQSEPRPITPPSEPPIPPPSVSKVVQPAPVILQAEQPEQENAQTIINPVVVPIVHAKPPPKQKEKPKQKTVVVVPTPTPQPKPSTPKEQPKPVIAPVLAIPEVKQKSPESKPVQLPPPQPSELAPVQQPKSKPDIGPVATIPHFKPNDPEPKQPPIKAELPKLTPVEQKVERPRYTPLPVKPPQPRQAPPKPKPAEKPVQSKPETPPEPDRPETPRTPPKLRTAIRKPSISRAASPPLEMPSAPPPKRKPTPETAPSIAVPKLGALGTVKRTFNMMG